MLDLLLTSTSAADPTGVKGLVQTPYLGVAEPGYNYSDVDGILSWGAFSVDQSGNVTANSYSGGTAGSVPAPTGNTAVDTPNITAAIAKLTAALAFGPSALVFQSGTYQVDGNTLVLEGLSEFALLSSGETVISAAPNRAGLPANITGNICTILDCTDFTVNGIVFDGVRDVIAPITPLTAAAPSGQPSVTVAAGAGANYMDGQGLQLYGGVGAADQALGQGFTISSVTPGGGTGGGDLITFTTNLTQNWTSTGGVALSDSYGPYAWTTAYITPYQTGNGNVVGTRTLSGEDQQNALHMISCSRFLVTDCTGRNIWESGIKMGTKAATSLTDGCSQGAIIGCNCHHGYDQGISLWVSNHITVQGCTIDSGGWADISTTASDYCTVTGCTLVNPVFAVPGDITEGSAITNEGGIGNVYSKNQISNCNLAGFKLVFSPRNWGTSTTTTAPTTSTYLEVGTAAGTSIQISATSTLIAGGLYSIYDGHRSEAITVATIVDATHVTLAGKLAYSHVSGVRIYCRIPQDTVIEGNTINGTISGSGIQAGPGVRSVIANNYITNWGTTSGQAINISLTSTNMPANSNIGGNGSTIANNFIENGGGSGITAYGQTSYYMNDLTITGNYLSNCGNGVSALDLKAAADCIVSGNTVEGQVGGGYGISFGNQGATGNVRCVISDNVVKSCQYVGMYLNVMTGCKITGNSIYSTGGGSGTYGAMTCQGLLYCNVSNNICMSNSQSGIYIAAGNSIQSQYNRFIGNTCRDDGTGTQVTTGSAITQQYGIREVASSDFNTFAFNECDTNSTGQLVVSGAHSVQYKNTVSGANIAPAVTTPGISTAAVQNTTGFDVVVYITATALTAVSVGAVAIGAQTMVYLPAGQTITLTYTGTPSWVWTAAG